jgi:hexosaminidase
MLPLAFLACSLTVALGAPLPTEEGPSSEGYLVWPPPKEIAATGPARMLHPDFTISHTHQSEILTASVARFQALATAAAAQVTPTPNALAELRIVLVGEPSEELSIDTLYNYTLEIADEGVATVTASSVFGAAYAMESFIQLLDEGAGAVVRSSVQIRDAPDFAWRGLMIDSGRR